MRLLQGKTAVVTGTRRGIGGRILERFAENGADVWAHARTESAEHEEFARNLSARHGVAVNPIYFDMTDRDAMFDAVKTIRSSGSGVDCLVNNAGVTHNALFEMSKEEELRNVMETNFFSVYFFTQYMVRLMLKKGCGSIVNISSVVGLDGHKGQSAYGASKAAVNTLTRTLALELGGKGIRVNAVAPGMTETDMVTTLPDVTRDNALREVEYLVPMGRFGVPDEIAEVVLFLSSDLSSFVTGQIIRADGGLI
ncbi:MAG: glucose 1-dehydrogenase [Clostridiales Family XIII bacterium]|nr:glucose 1-dehydrogenase [Clostridiales Family XIII bacterium]